MNLQKAVMVAPVGDNLEALFVGIRDFPTEQVILLTPKSRMADANQAQHELERFRIPTRIVPIAGNVWEEMFRKIAELKASFGDKEIIVNTATGDRLTTCAATSAAFVNGLKAISVNGNESMLLPILKFSYYTLLTEKKMSILKLLNERPMSLAELSRKTRMSLPLISYHINGNLKSEGLVSMGLVDVMEKSGQVFAELALLGKLLLKGYVGQPQAS